MTIGRYDLVATDAAGNVLSGATVEVRAETPGTPLAALKSDRDGLVAETNPITTDANGKAGFYVVGGAYKITVTSGALTEIRRYVPIGMAREYDTIDLDTQTTGDLDLATRVAGELPLANGGLGVSLSDPGADRIPFWDDSGGAVAWLALGSNLSTSGTTLNAAGGAIIDAVATYSVDNTGGSDTHTAFQTAVDSATTAGNALYFKAGTYDLGSSTIILPDYCQVIAHPNAIFKRSADPTFSHSNLAMIMAGNYTVWNGGQFSNTLGSAAVNTLNSPYCMFSAEGARLYNARTIGKWYVGPYFYAVNPNDATCTITIASPGVITRNSHGLSANHPVSFTTTGALPTGLVASTTYYVVGSSITTNTFQVSATPGGAAINTSGSQSGTHTLRARAITKDCIIADCVSVTVANRGFYVYGASSNCKIVNCVIEGNSTTTYGVNVNAANASGSVNAIQHLLVSGCTAVSCTTNSFVFGDYCFYCTFIGCSAFTSGNTGFTIEVANAGTPQFCKMIGCMAHACTTNGFLLNGSLHCSLSGCDAISCGVGFLISNANAVQYNSLTGCKATGCTGNGFDVGGNSVRCDLISISAINNTGTGVIINTGANRTISWGRAFGNTAAQYTDNGTSTGSSMTTT